MSFRSSETICLCLLSLVLLTAHGSNGQQFRGGNFYPSSTRLFGVTYSPFALRLESICLTTEEVEADMAIIAQVADHIRIYNINSCPDLTQTILSISRRNGIRVILGLFISGDRSTNEDEVNAVGPILADFGSIIDAIAVGNEVLFANIVSLDNLISYITRVKEIVASSGFNIPVSTGEVWPVYESGVGQRLTEATDFLCMNMQPFWEGWDVFCPDGTDCVSAGNYVHLRADGLETFLGKPVWICESGWPTEGERCCEGRQFARGGLAAGPSESNTTIFVNEIVQGGKAIGRPTYIHAMFDEEWKRIWAPCGTCEGLSTMVDDPSCNSCELDYHFGVYGANRLPKAGVTLPSP